MIKPQTEPTNLSLPQNLQALESLAYNLWWTWNPEAQWLFQKIHPGHWEAHHNPVKLLRETEEERLHTLAGDESYRHSLARVSEALAHELSRETWISQNYPDYQDQLVVYLCAEFGLHECLPIYSGGLGVLAGDHTKSASDIGLPFIGVGLLYRSGYFTQQIDTEGRQIALFPEYDFSSMPLRKVVDNDGREVRTQVELPGRVVHIRAWLVEVGRSLILLLDTDFPANDPADRAITHQLYGGDRDMRISQEIVLGIGGVRMLRKLGYAPTVWHMNEGHVAFSTFERIREFMQEKGMSFEDAKEAVTASSVFTTHTPVPAGNEAFSLPRIDRYFRQFCRNLGLRLADLMQLGLQTGANGEKYFSMTVLALRLSCRSNGVSQLHGAVSRLMWAHLWPGIPVQENPITSITNGVHTQTWIAQQMARLYQENLGGDWTRHLDDADFWQNVSAIPEQQFKKVHRELKVRLIQFVRERLKVQYQRQGASPETIAAVDNWLDPDVLTIGFARRFAPYKRADLILSDLPRLERLVNHPDHPVQIIFAGKAHPENKEGQSIIQKIWQISQQPAFLGKVIVLENYDMNMARHLVQGVDIWLNNPRRPREASGTSGQKVPINGGINFSVLDGWWPEAFNGANGWKIGEEKDYESIEEQDHEDALSLYDTLENQIIPLYYGLNRPPGQPSWMEMVKASMASVIPVFNTEVMLQNYFKQLYKVAVDRHRQLLVKDLNQVASFARFKEILQQNWPLVHFTSISTARDALDGETDIQLSAELYLGELHPDHVQVELFGAPLNGNGYHTVVVPLEQNGNGSTSIARYSLKTRIPLGRDAELRLRVIPRHPLLAHKHELGLIYWKDVD